MNLYEILGVARDASEAFIRAAYLKKAKSMHPDHGGDPEAFKEVARAYGVLGNPAKRLAYDQTGHEDAGPSPEDAAVAIVRNLIEMVVSNNGAPAQTDFLKEMRGQIDQAMANANQQESDITRKIVRCKALAQRFTGKSSDDLIAKILQGRIDEMDRTVAAIDRDRANLVAARELLASYKYKIDPPQYATSSGYAAARGAMAQQQNAMGALGGWMTS